MRGQDRKAVDRFTRELIPLVLNGPPTATGFGEGRPPVREVVAYWPALVPRDEIETRVEVIRMKVPLFRIAHGRSGDKGDTSNIGIIAFDEAQYPILVREVTVERVKAHFGDMVKGKIERYRTAESRRAEFPAARSFGRRRHVVAARGRAGKDDECGSFANGDRCRRVRVWSSGAKDACCVSR